MLYETLSQPFLLLVFLLAGILGGLVFDIGNFIKFLCSNKKVPSIIIDFLQTIICCLMLFFVNLKYNYGLFRLFPLVIFVVSFSIERFTLGKIIAKFYNLCYNLLTKLFKKVTKKFKHDKKRKDD